jgi:hypothetical protein
MSSYDHPLSLQVLSSGDESANEETYGQDLSRLYAAMRIQEVEEDVPTLIGVFGNHITNPVRELKTWWSPPPIVRRTLGRTYSFSTNLYRA